MNHNYFYFQTKVTERVIKKPMWLHIRKQQTFFMCSKSYDKLVNLMEYKLIELIPES